MSTRGVRHDPEGENSRQQSDPDKYSEAFLEVTHLVPRTTDKVLHLRGVKRGGGGPSL